MTPTKGFPVASETVSESISLTKLSPELARQNFHKLLLSNANYFGNLNESGLKAVLNIQGDTA